MIDDKRRKAGSRGGAAVGLVLAALVVGRLVLHRVLGVDLPDVGAPDVDLPDVDLPGWLRWVGPAFGAAKLLWLAGLGVVVVLAMVGEWSRRRKDGER